LSNESFRLVLERRANYQEILEMINKIENTRGIAK
jgi:hypothetical protein